MAKQLKAKKKAVVKKKTASKKNVGRPRAGMTKKSLAVCVRVEPFLKELIFKKFGGWQAFVDHHAYELAPKKLRPSK